MAAHWYTYRHRLAEIISVSQLATVNDDFAQYWTDICSIPIELDHPHGQTVHSRRATARMTMPHLVAVAMVSMLNQFCYIQLSENTGDSVDDQACITTLANIFYRTIYHKETA